MVDELSNLLDDFPGAPNRTWCFTHILNLIAKSILKQFDLPKAKADEALDAAARALADLAGDIEVEEELMGDDLVGDDEDDDSSEGLADIRGEMSAEEIVEPIQSSINKFTFDSFHHTSSINSPLPSRTPPQLSFHNGSPSSSNMQR